MTTRHEEHQRISWGRAGQIFGTSPPPKMVWEQQFDGMSAELRRLARTPYQEMDSSDLWYYYHDLAYVELQPELFDYLFPACLMDWHDSLMSNQPCSHGDAEFHYGVHRGDVFQKMMTAERREEVFAFLRDSFTERLDTEFHITKLRNQSPTCCWIQRFNSLGIVMSGIDMIWNAWWSLDTVGRAITATEYCSGLMYFDGENPLFDRWGGASPDMWGNDSFIYDVGWMPQNIAFLSTVLTVSFVREKLVQAAGRLEGRPESDQARRLVDDLPECEVLIEERISELPDLLGDPNAEGWTA